MIDPRDAARADVYKAGVLAAALTRQEQYTTFRYLPQYLKSEGPAVATSLPKSESAVRIARPNGIPPFFANLLPEGRRLLALKQRVKTSLEDEFSLLLAAGADPVGDVQVVPSGEHNERPQPAANANKEQAWSSLDFEVLFRRSVDAAEDPGALAGVQAKVSEGMLSFPVRRRDGAYLLKLNPPDFPYVVENEAYFLRAATDVGIPAAQASVVVDKAARTGLLVKRFDRLLDNQPDGSGSVHPIAQEDGCQVMGLYPGDKYRVNTEELFIALQSICASRAVAARDLFRQIVFAYLMCNGDAHAKNFSVLHLSGAAGGEWRIAPVYDLPSSYFYGDHTMALRINGKDGDDLGRKDFLTLANEISLAQKAAIRILDHQLDAAHVWLAGIDALPFDAQKIHKFKKAVEYRKKRLT